MLGTPPGQSKRRPPLPLAPARPDRYAEPLGRIPGPETDMQVDIYGIKVETPRVTCYLWSPWRASALEHRLFDVIRSLPNVTVEEDNDELRAHVADARTFRQALTAMSRVLKGWQEEAAD